MTLGSNYHVVNATLDTFDRLPRASAGTRL